MSRLELVELRCPGCGGNLQYTAGSPVASCPYCDARIALVSQQQGRPTSLDGHDYRMVPFSITSEQFRDRFLQFLADGDYTPDDVLAQVSVRTNTGLFAALYLFEGTARVSWSASAGFDRTESYVTTKTVTRNGRSVSEPTTETRTVTDWRPVTGELLHDYRLPVLASDGVPATVSRVLERAASLPALDALPHVDPDRVEGYALEPFELPASEAFAKRGDKRLQAQVKGKVEGAVPGDKSKQVRFTLTRTGESTTRLFRPVWLAVYQYNGQQYAFAVEGADGASAGTRPEDKGTRREVERLEKELKNANMLALIAGLLSFFVLPFLGAILVGVLWYAYTQGKKKQLKAIRDEVTASRARRAEHLARVQRGEARLGDGG